MKKTWLLPLAALTLSLTACDLLPAEETFRAAPVIHEYTQVEYTLAECTRGEMTLSKTINCVYIPVRSEGVSFVIGGLRYDDIYVSAGDSVKEGDLIAQVVVDDIVSQIDSLSLAQQSLKLRLTQLEQNRALAIKRLNVTDEGADEKTRSADLAALNESYDGQKQDLEDQLTITQMRLSDQQKRLSERQLRAPIDGTVTYVRRLREGDVTVVGERVATVADSTLSLFRAETEYWEYFKPGDVYTITSKKVEYEAVVVEPEQVGAPVQERKTGEKGYVYLMLSEPTFELEDNDRGTLILTLDHRDSVLRVPEGAISTINGETVVYYQTEDGMRAYKKVRTGLAAEKMVEIIEGLEEGDIVIAG